jgi:hypothetical protein
MVTGVFCASVTIVASPSHRSLCFSYVFGLGSKVVTMVTHTRARKEIRFQSLLLSDEVYVHARVSPLSPLMVQRGVVGGWRSLGLPGPTTAISS